MEVSRGALPLCSTSGAAKLEYLDKTSEANTWETAKNRIRTDFGTGEITRAWKVLLNSVGGKKAKL